MKKKEQKQIAAAKMNVPIKAFLAMNIADARRAGYSIADAISAGYSKTEVEEWESIPILDKPYAKLLADIQAKKQTHKQSTFGEIDDFDPNLNVCKTPMCTAGHLVNMAGEIGYRLKNKYGWSIAAALIHYKSHPDIPAQNFGSIPQDHALAYIEYVAGIEKGV